MKKNSESRSQKKKFEYGPQAKRARPKPAALTDLTRLRQSRGLKPTGLSGRERGDSWSGDRSQEAGEGR